MSPTEIFYVLLGLATIVPAFYANRQLYRAGGPGASALEIVYYVFGLGALLCGWYFNFAYFRAYGSEAGWAHWTKLLFVNPASASAAQDLIIANVLLFPLWTVADARRSGMRAGWWYFPMSVFTSFAFAMALFLAIQDRQNRWRKA